VHELPCWSVRCHLSYAACDVHRPVCGRPVQSGCSDGVHQLRRGSVRLHSRTHHRVLYRIVHGRLCMRRWVRERDCRHMCSWSVQLDRCRVVHELRRGSVRVHLSNGGRDVHRPVCGGPVQSGWSGGVHQLRRGSVRCNRGAADSSLYGSVCCRQLQSQWVSVLHAVSRRPVLLNRRITGVHLMCSGIIFNCSRGVIHHHMSGMPTRHVLCDTDHCIVYYLSSRDVHNHHQLTLVHSGGSTESPNNVVGNCVPHFCALAEPSVVYLFPYDCAASCSVQPGRPTLVVAPRSRIACQPLIVARWPFCPSRCPLQAPRRGITSIRTAVRVATLVCTSVPSALHGLTRGLAV
jgi:hypothetical protein